jgi:hypothetical protein
MHPIVTAMWGAEEGGLLKPLSSSLKATSKTFSQREKKKSKTKIPRGVRKGKSTYNWSGF